MVIPVLALGGDRNGKLVVVNASVSGDGGVNGAELTVRGPADAKGQTTWLATCNLDLQELSQVWHALGKILNAEVRP